MSFFLTNSDFHLGRIGKDRGAAMQSHLVFFLVLAFAFALTIFLGFLYGPSHLTGDLRLLIVRVSDCGVV